MKKRKVELKKKIKEQEKKIIGLENEILEYKNRNNPQDQRINEDANKGCWMGQPHFHNGFTPNTETLLILYVFK